MTDWLPIRYQAFCQGEMQFHAPVAMCTSQWEEGLWGQVTGAFLMQGENSPQCDGRWTSPSTAINKMNGKSLFWALMWLAISLTHA